MDYKMLFRSKNQTDMSQSFFVMLDWEAASCLFCGYHDMTSAPDKLQIGK